MKIQVAVFMLSSVVCASAFARPETTRDGRMTSGVQIVATAASGNPTVYGAIMPFTISKADSGKVIEVVADSPRPITIEVYEGEIARTETEWPKKHAYLGHSGDQPETKPSFKMPVTEGTFTALFLTTLPPGSKPEPFTVSYGKEIRTPTEQDKADFQAAKEQQQEADAAARRIQENVAKADVAKHSFTAIATDGKVISTAGYRGDVVLVEFWSASDATAKDEIQSIVSAYTQYKDKGFEVIGVNLDTASSDESAFVQANGITWREVADGKSFDGPIAKKYGVTTSPQNFLLDKTGKVIGHNIAGANVGATVARTLGIATMTQ